MPWEELGKQSVKIDQSVPGTTNGVVVSGSNVLEYTFADQVEVRSTDRTYFSSPVPLAILRKLKDFEFYITDSHNNSVSANQDMSFCISASNVVFVSFFDTDKVAYRWKGDAVANASEAIVVPTKKSQISRDMSPSIVNVSLTQLLLNSEYKFYSGVNELTGKIIKMDLDIIQDMKKGLLSNIPASSFIFMVKYNTTPINGSITVNFKGWV